jgi:hypothetical protein
MIEYLNRRLRFPSLISRVIDSIIHVCSFRRFRIVALRGMTSAVEVPFASMRSSRPAIAHHPARTDRAGTGPAPVTRFTDAPSAGYRVIRDATVSGGSTSALTRTGLLVPNETLHARAEARIEGPGVLLRGQDAILRRINDPIFSLPSALFLGGRGSDNWYHFLVEIAPRLMLRGEFPAELQEFPLLVPEATLAAAPSRQLLNLLAPDAEVIPLPTGRAVSVRTLLWVDVPLRSAYKLNHWVEIRPEHEAIDPFFYREFREHVLQLLQLSINPGSGPPVFLDRGPRDARPYNRYEILSLAARHGFTPVDLGSLDLSAQLQTVLGASALLGPHGAAWSNILFAAEGACALSLTPIDRRITGFSGFQNLAAVAGVRLRDMTMRLVGDRNVADYVQVEKGIARMLDPTSEW